MEKSEISDEIRIVLSEPTDNAQALLTARRLAAQVGFSEPGQVMIATAVSELATNILRYAKEGAVRLKIVRQNDRTGVEVLAEDDGPGIENLPEAMKEHFSGGSGLGLGLPSVQRIMDEFTIDSRPGHGTRVLARKWR
jgi:serine/threonine-protein kinase RsbT